MYKNIQDDYFFTQKPTERSNNLHETNEFWGKKNQLNRNAARQINRQADDQRKRKEKEKKVTKR